MIRKLTYEKPQSEAVRLPAPTLLVGSFTDEPGVWEEVMIEPESFDDFVFTPDGLEGLL